jgi:hypothetical protein
MPENLEPAVAQIWPGQVWRHKKRGTNYWIIGLATLQVTDSNDGKMMVVYEPIDDVTMWVRSTDDFLDGKFERVL